MNVRCYGTAHSYYRKPPYHEHHNVWHHNISRTLCYGTVHSYDVTMYHEHFAIALHTAMMSQCIKNTLLWHCTQLWCDITMYQEHFAMALYTAMVWHHNVSRTLCYGTAHSYGMMSQCIMNTLLWHCTQLWCHGWYCIQLYSFNTM